MYTVPENILNDLNEQLTTSPVLLVLGIKDWLTYEQWVKGVADTYLSVTMKDDSPVPLLYRGKPVIMKTNEVKELIKQLVQANQPVPSVEVPTNSGGVKPMTKTEREMEAPEQKRKADLIEQLNDAPQWWNGDQVITEQSGPAATTRPPGV